MRTLLALVSGSLVATCCFASVAFAADPFTVTIDAPPSKVGAAAQVHVKLVPGAGLHVNKEYPTSLKLVAPKSVELAKASYSGSDGKIEEREASFEVTYTARAAGKQTITGTFSFAVCSKESCDPHKQPLSFVVDVK